MLYDIRDVSACGSVSKESACNEGDLGSIPGLGRSPGGWQGNSLQYSCLENPHGQRRLVGYNPWGHRESDMTKQARPLRFMIQIEHVKGKRAVLVRVLCVKCLKSTLANLNRRDLSAGYRADSEQIGPVTSRRPR